MCLGEIAQVTGLPAKDTAEVALGRGPVTVSLMTLDDPVAVGDWVLVHSGFALERLTEEQRRDALSIRSAKQEENG